MGKRKSVTKLTLRDFHDQIDNAFGYSDVEIVSIDEEDDISVVAKNVDAVELQLPPVIANSWPRLGSPVKATESGGVTMTPLQDPTKSAAATARNFNTSAQSHLIPGDKSESKVNLNAWTNVKTLLNNEKTNRLRKHLKRFPIEYVNNQVMIPLKISENGALKWKHAIVGYFVDKNLSYFQVRSWAQRVWKIDVEDVVTLDNGFVVFNLRDENTLDSILENGPYFCGGKHIVIKKWHPGMQLTKSVFSSIPVWVKFYNVPLELWTENGLSSIASVIGNPLYLDDFTQNHSRLTFARVCVEVDAAKEIPKSFVVNLGYGEPFEIRVEVPWKLQACNVCKIFGHSTNTCTVKPKGSHLPVWKPKERVGQDVPVVQEQNVKESVGQDVPVAYERSAKDGLVSGSKDDWVEVVKRKNQTPGMPMAISLSSSVSPTNNAFGVLEKCDDSGASAVEVTMIDVAGVVSCDATPILLGQGSTQQEPPPVALRRSARFREPPRIPLEGDFIGPRHSLNQVVGESPTPSSTRDQNKKKLKEKIKMLKASRI